MTDLYHDAPTIYLTRRIPAGPTTVETPGLSLVVEKHSGIGGSNAGRFI
jgi:hypothetical protein